jgi:hypothetical protein
VLRRKVGSSARVFALKRPKNMSVTVCVPVAPAMVKRLSLNPGVWDQLGQRSKTPSQGGKKVKKETAQRHL